MKITRADSISISRKCRVACAILLIFATSCATPDVSTDGTPRQSLSDPASPDGLQVLVSPEVSEQAAVAQAPVQPEQAAKPVVSPAEPPIARTIERVEEGHGAEPVMPTIVAESPATTTSPAPPSDRSRPPTSVAPMAETSVVGPAESADAQSGQPAQPSPVLPHVVREETLPSPPKESVAQTTTERPSRQGTGEPGQVAPPSGGVRQPIAPAPATPTAAAANKRFSLDFKRADIDEVLRTISRISRLNIVAAHGLKGKDREVTVLLNDVEWRQALDIILRAKGLSYEQDGNVLYVGSRAEIQKSKEDRVKDIERVALHNQYLEERRQKVEEAKRKTEEERQRIQEEERRLAGEPPCTRVIHLAYTKAADVKKHLDRLKTRRGSVELNEQTNTVIVNDVQSACLKMVAVASELDTPPKDPFVTKLLPFNYAKAADLKIHLATLKTKDGSIVVDERSSRIIVKDLPETVERIETFLKQIDIPTPQVLIEARIIEATRKFSQSLGIQWGGTGIPTSSGSKTGVTAFGGGGAGSIRFPGLTSTSGTTFPTTTGGGVPFAGPVPLAVNLPVASPYAAIGMTIGSLANRFLVGAQLSAAEDQGKIRTLSAPRVATQDNEEAEIKQGTQVPYTTIDSSGRTVVQFQDAFIKLKVKPHITPDGRVAMKVEAERSFPGDRVDFSGGFVFPINTRKATTNILVQNGSTVVIGGLFQSSESTNVAQVPALGDVPILGWLFKRRTLGPDERVELLIFLTPSVLQESQR